MKKEHLQNHERHGMRPWLILFGFSFLLTGDLFLRHDLLLKSGGESTAGSRVEMNAPPGRISLSKVGPRGSMGDLYAHRTLPLGAMNTFVSAMPTVLVFSLKPFKHNSIDAFCARRIFGRSAIRAVPVIDSNSTPIVVESEFVAFLAKNGKTASATQELESVLKIKLDVLHEFSGEGGETVAIYKAQGGTPVVLDPISGLSTVSYAYPIFIDPASRTKLIPTDQVLISTVKKLDSRIKKEIQEAGFSIVRPAGSERLNAFLLRIEKPCELSPFPAVERLMKIKGIRWAEPNFLRKIEKTEPVRTQ